MSVFLAVDWLVPQGHEAETYEALATVRGHVLASHAEVRSVRVLRQIAEGQSPVGFRWVEEYDSLADSQALALAEECDEVWLRVWLLAVPGSHRQTVWDDDGRPDWLAP